MGLRRRAREHALQMLYQADVGGLDAAETIAMHWQREPEPEPAARTFAEALVRCAMRERARLDEAISGAARNWSLERIGVVERNVVRLALAELESEPDTPAAVVIDEAVEIARTFGEAESGGFVHGLVEGARRRLQGQAKEPT